MVIFYGPCRRSFIGSLPSCSEPREAGNEGGVERVNNTTFNFFNPEVEENKRCAKIEKEEVRKSKIEESYFSGQWKLNS